MCISIQNFIVCGENRQDLAIKIDFMKINYSDVLEKAQKSQNYL